MSSQGSVTDRSHSYEERLLECWGEWASTGLGVGISRAGIWVTATPGLMFTEQDILNADRAIASLDPVDKRIIKRVFWFKSAGEGDYEMCDGAVSAFADALGGLVGN